MPRFRRRRRGFAGRRGRRRFGGRRGRRARPLRIGYRL